MCQGAAGIEGGQVSEKRVTARQALFFEIYIFLLVSFIELMNERVN